MTTTTKTLIQKMRMTRTTLMMKRTMIRETTMAMSRAMVTGRVIMGTGLEEAISGDKGSEEDTQE